MKAYSEMTIEELLAFIRDKGNACEMEEADHAFAELCARYGPSATAAWESATCGGKIECGHYLKRLRIRKDGGKVVTCLLCRLRGHRPDAEDPACPDYHPRTKESKP